MDVLVGPVHPRKEEAGHAGIRFDRVRERIVDGLVPPELEAAVPGAFDERFGWGDHEEQVDDLAEAGQQIAAGFARIRREAVEAKTIDQQMRHLAALGLVRHVMIELLIDHVQLIRG